MNLKKLAVDEKEEKTTICQTTGRIKKVEYDNNNNNIYITTDKDLNGNINFPDSKYPQGKDSLTNSYPLKGIFYNYNNNNSYIGDQLNAQYNNNFTNITTTKNPIHNYQYVNDTYKNNMNEVLNTPIQNYTNNRVSPVNVNYRNNDNIYKNTVVLQTVPSTITGNSTKVVSLSAANTNANIPPQIVDMTNMQQKPLLYTPNGNTVIQTKSNFYQIPNNSYPNQRYINKYNHGHQNNYDTSLYKTEVMLYNGGKGGDIGELKNNHINNAVLRNNNIRRNGTNITHMNTKMPQQVWTQHQRNPFMRTRSLTPSALAKNNYSNKNKNNSCFKVSPLKNFCIKTQKSLPNRNSSNIPKPVCTHEITYTYPKTNMHMQMNNNMNNGAKINSVTFIKPNDYTDPNKYSNDKYNKGEIENRNINGNDKNKNEKKTETETETEIETEKERFINDLDLENFNFKMPLNRFDKTYVHCADKGSDMSSTGTIHLDTLPIKEQIRKLKQKNKYLKKENENLSDMSRLYKNECNRLREMIVKHNGADLNNLKNDDYDKVNLKLEEENEKLRNQLKALGKGILNTEDSNGVKKILAKQIVDLQEENELCRNKIKALKKNNDVNHQVLFNLNKIDVSADAMDSIFMQTKNIIIEGHQSINILYLNLKHILEQLFEKIKSVINKDDYTKKEKLLYVNHLEEIISENFEELNEIVLKINKLRKEMKTMRAKVFDINRGNPYCGCKPARVILEEDIKHLEAELHRHSVLIKNMRKLNLSLNLKNLSAQYTKTTDFQEGETDKDIATEEKKEDCSNKKNYNKSSTFCTEKTHFLSIEDEKNNIYGHFETNKNISIKDSNYSSLTKRRKDNIFNTNIENNKDEETLPANTGLHNKLQIIEAQLNALNTKMNTDYGDSASKKQVTHTRKSTGENMKYSSNSSINIDSVKKKKHKKHKKKRKEKSKKNDYDTTDSSSADTVSTESNDSEHDSYTSSTSSSSPNSSNSSKKSSSFSSSQLSSNEKYEKSYKKYISNKNKGRNKNKEIEASKQKMTELLALLKGKDNEQLIEDTKYYVNEFGKHKSQNNYNLQKVYENLNIIKNSIKHTEDDTDMNILSLIETQAHQIKIFGNCINDLTETLVAP